jgi:hypothetical protein
MARETGTGKMPDEQIDMGTLVRLGAWGGAACVALAAVVLATQSDIGAKRLSPPQAVSSQPAIATIARVPEPDPETRRMAETIRTIASDRDRLLARVTVIERNLEDVTGSVGRLNTVKEQSPPPAAPAPAPEALRSPGPTLGSTISVALALSGPPATRPASQSSSPPAAEQPMPETDEFGVDLGGAANLDALRELWSAAKGNHGALLEGLRPVIAVRDRTKPAGIELRLIVGPLTDKAAAKLCASMAASGWTCKSAPFDGQRLAAR